MESEIHRLQELERANKLIESDKRHLRKLERIQRLQRNQKKGCGSIFWHPTLNPEGKPPSGQKNHNLEEFDSSCSETDSGISDINVDDL